jgi:cullin 1
MAGAPVVVQLEEGWNKIRSEGIDRLEHFLDTGEIPPDVVQPSDPTKPKKVFTTLSYSELYTTVYNMCTQRAPNNWSEQLYTRYGEAMLAYAQRQVLPALKGLKDRPLMVELLHRWNNHKIYVKWMDRFFTYLDRYYVKLQSTENLNNKGILVFFEAVFGTVKNDLRAALLNAIEAERAGDMVDHDLVKGIVTMYIDLGLGKLDVYNADFEEQFLPATSSHFVRQASGWLSADSFPDYLRKAEAALTAEEQRVENYLHRSTLPKLKHVVIQAVVAQPQKQLLEKETAVYYLLDNDKREDLQRMHKIFGLVEGGLNPIATIFRSYVTERANTVVNDRLEELKNATKQEALNDPSFIQAMLDLHDRFKSIVQESFSQDSLFQKALKEAFETALNRELGKYSFAALMSSFCDRILKKSGERLSDDQIEVLLTKMVELFSFLTDKDLFAEIYRNQLSKRLLSETSASEDAEKCMIQKLKMKCGAQFTSKLEGMITDLSLAADIQKRFREHMEHINAKDAMAGMDFSVTVLTTGFWPTYHVHNNVTLHPAMQKAITVFQNFYNGQTQHRRLQWVHLLGQATMSAQLARKQILVLNSYQAIILLLFEGDEELSFDAIVNATGLDEGLVKKLLATLTISKFKVLKKTGDNPKAIADDDRFSPNTQFQCPQLKLKIPPPITEETHNKERVVEDRSIAIEAAIVRIMKARKQLSHQQLVSEVIAQLAFFKPNPKVIKQRIEHLIEREYLERDQNQASTYRYLA